jgi:hypothetical protein
MAGASTQVKRYAILFHRWMGVAFCVLFAVWFVSGIVMMYWTYPGVGNEERLARAPALDPTQIELSAGEAFELIQPAEAPARVHLQSVDGRPAYRFYWGKDHLTVFADTGESLFDVTPEMALRIASQWSRQPPASARFEGRITKPDQWTVSGAFRAHRPMYKYSWPDGQEVYVSPYTAEVVQHTTRGSRIGAYFGAIPHWLYFTPLRANQPLWSDVVIWSSGIGTVMSALGLVIGLWLYSPSKRFRFPDGPRSVPYSGQKRWHTILGLFFGLVTCTWAFSGMMSMSPFPEMTESRLPSLGASLRGGQFSLAAFAPKRPADAFAQIGREMQVKEIEYAMFDGKPVYLARETPLESRIVPVDGAPMREFGHDRILQLLARDAAPHRFAETRLVTDFEAYYVDRHGQRPLPVLFVRLDDEQGSMYYVDPKTARIVQRYGSESRWNRWLYNGLHSFDLPWLYRRRPAWDIFVMALMLGGTALCVTSLSIAWRRLKRKVGMWRAGRAAGARAGSHRPRLAMRGP